MTLSSGEVRQVLAEADQIYTPTEISSALDRLASSITERLENSNLLVLCVMNGALIPAGHLLTRLDFPLELDYVHATRYAGDVRGGELSWRVKPDTELRDRNVLVVDDILDEGITLARILDYCRAQGARRVYSCVFVEKRVRRQVSLTVDFVGLEIPNRYVFGFGMDYKGYLRNVEGIYAVKGL